MSLSKEYLRQFAWRDWQTALSLCPLEPGQRVLDLGCGPGDLSRELAKRGANVVAMDSSQEMISLAQHRNIEGCTFLRQDLRSPQLEPQAFDGIWCSFTAAYFTDFEDVFRRWKPFLKQKAWVCFTEMDDLLGHEPLPGDLREQIGRFYQEAFTNKRYDFRSGHKIAALLKNEGFAVQEILLKDKELSFLGAADPEILQAWSDRLDRMAGLKAFFDGNFEEFKTTFLRTLAQENHTSNCRVLCLIGTCG